MNSEPLPVAVPQQTRAGSSTAHDRGPAPDPVAVLASAVDSAIAALSPRVLRDAEAGPVLESMLAAFAEAVAPVQAGLVVRSPADPLTLVQGYLGNAFTHAAGGDPDATRAALIAARAALAHLVDDDRDDEGGNWRF
ncbi:hypothetical protein ACFFSW_05145 [Saccharothrix longispora]|uniref:Uncharacterized protein n=1 Tax=Saccharothrix longispora TaxID=33920 RepID=A0ABU1PRG3_9PSEU|nr:hypothetical protein [Saccharothrix longispora]MDR6593230.1 hypothetical protein [Saccharothrix longispora]